MFVRLINVCYKYYILIRVAAAGSAENFDVRLNEPNY